MPAYRTFVLTVVPPSRREGSSPTGLVARSLARQLAEDGARVVVVTESAPSGGCPDGARLVPGSLARPQEWAPVLAGAEGLFLAGAGPTTAPAILAAARASGLVRVVLLSSHGSEYEVHHPADTWHWLAVERAVETSGLKWTVIRPSAVMGSMLEGTYPATGSGWPAMVTGSGLVAEALLDDGYYPFVHEDDLAGVAAAALRSDRYDGHVLEAVGPPLSTRERVAHTARAISGELATRSLTADEGRARWRADGWPEEAIEVTLYALAEYRDRYAELAAWTDAQRPTVAELIGRPLKDYARWAWEHRAWFR